jgi:WD40 repeat protein
MVGEFGEVLVMDWGIAKILGDTTQAAAESAQRAEATEPGTAERFRELADAELKKTTMGLTMDGTVMGTPHYMSPEQADGRVTEIDQQSDVFSLGAILYAILTLRPPVEADSPYDVIELIKRGHIQPPTIYNVTTGTSGNGKSLEGAAANPKHFQPLPHCPGGKVPAALSSVAMKALTVDKERRYATVAELAADIEAYQGGFATGAEQAGLFTQLRLLVQRHKREFAVGFAAWLIITALAVWFVINLRAKERRAIAGEQKAVSEAERATAAEKVAVEKGEAARRALAKAQIALADSAFRNADLPGLLQALEGCPPDLRDQSWQYLAAKRDASLRTVEISREKKPTEVLAVPGQPGQFVLAGNLPAVAIVDVAGGDRVVQTFATGTRGGKALAISGDGQVLAVAVSKGNNKGNSVLLFDVGTGAIRKELTSPLESGALALNRDGTRLAVAGIGQGVRDGCALLDTGDGRTQWRFQGSARKIDFSPDGQRVLVLGGVARRQFTLLRAEDGVEIAQLGANVSSQAVSPDGKRVAVATHEGDCYLLDGVTGGVLGKGRPHTGRIYSMAFTADNHLLTSGDEGKFGDARWVFRLLDPEKFTTVGTYFGLQPGGETKWSLHPQSGDLLTAESPPRLWRLPAGLELVRLAHRAEQAWGGCFLSDTVVLARKEFGLQRYDLAKPGQAIELGKPFNYKSSGSHLGSGTFAVGLAPQRQARMEVSPAKIFALENGEPVEKFELKHDGRIVKLVFEASGERLAAVGGSVGGRVLSGAVLEVFDTKSGRSLLKVPGQFEEAVFAGGARNLVAIKRHDRNADETEDLLMAFDGATGAALRTVTNRFRVNALAASPDGRLVAIAGSDQSVHVFDAATFVEKSVFRAHDGEITALAFHPTLPLIATAAMDRSVKLWEHDTARMVEHFLGLGGTPVVLAFNPSGTMLLVDGQERTTRVFDVSGAAKSAAK